MTNRELISLEEAFHAIDDAAAGIALSRCHIAAGESLGRTAAVDHAAQVFLPPFDKATMDGYALPEEETGRTYRVIETVAAGAMPTMPLRPATAAKVMTGSPVPQGTDRVVPIEHVRCVDDTIEVIEWPIVAGQCIARQGEDVRPGDTLVAAGRRLTALDVANLIAGGVTEVDVFRPIRAAILSTGNELVASPSDLAPGKIIDSNGPLLAMLAGAASMDVIGPRLIGDDRAATQTAIVDAAGRADIVILSGGVSVGEFDFVARAMADAGLRVRFDGVAVKPGRPATFALGQGRLFFGLPGNPVAAYLGFHLFVLRAAVRMTRSPLPIRELRFPLADDFSRASATRVEYVPGRLSDGGEVGLVAYHGSAHLAALAEADGFAIVPAGVSRMAAGEAVRFMLLHGGG